MSFLNVVPEVATEARHLREEYTSDDTTMEQ